jgi:hypothetical protein
MLIPIYSSSPGNAVLALRWLRDATALPPLKEEQRMHIQNRYDMTYQTRSGLFRCAEGQKLLFLITTIVVLAFAWVYVW